MLLRPHRETLDFHGRYFVDLFDKDGNFKWSDTIENLVTTVGKNQVLDAALAGSAYTVTGPFMGLISSVGYSAISAADTMASHAGWTEAGNANAPQYSGTRKTSVFSAASAGSKALSAALAFTFTSVGTIKGVFQNFGSAATNAIDGTVGTLMSAGLFTGGDRIVAIADVANVSWSLGV